MKLNRVQVRRHVQDLVKYVTMYRKAIQGEIASFMEGTEYVPRDVAEGWGDACQSSSVDDADNAASIQYFQLVSRLRGMMIDKVISKSDCEKVMKAFRSLFNFKATPEGFDLWQEIMNRTIFELFPDFEISEDFKVVHK